MWGWPIERLYAIVDLANTQSPERGRRGRRADRAVEQNFTEAAAGTLRPARKPTAAGAATGAELHG